ncbi:uncharacterized protein LOC133968303 [Platichthys flesus]|uniref:uncharacterized protein LOC133968303 n=1 Tax=Platichthys flesus TaxID=8260 RepID=UPI002DBAAA51|nr:uncharacterized protein LOC133968303 [Platichthys flesus]
MKPLFISLLLAALCPEGRAQQDMVQQPGGDVTATGGEAATLGCRYVSSSTSVSLLWYKQEGTNNPTFILIRFQVGEGNTADDFRERFSSTLNSTSRSSPLKIQKLQLSDSAVYYCALQPTVTGNYTTLYNNLWSKDTTPHPPLEGVTHSISCEELTPVHNEEFSAEGSSVTLSYNSSKVNPGDYFFWYRQNPGQAPEFLLSHSASGEEAAPTSGLKIQVEQNQIHMIISSAAVTDSAVYYCAVRPTVTGNYTTLYKNSSCQKPPLLTAHLRFFPPLEGDISQ